MKTELTVGDKAYYEIVEGFIVPVKILEVSVFFSVNEISYQYSKSGEWEILYAGKMAEQIISDPSEIAQITSKATSIGYTFYSIDEFLRTSITLSKENGLFKTLDEAYKHIRPLNKRITKRKHKKIASIRLLMVNYINKQRISVGSTEINNWREKLRERNLKKIYVRNR